MMDDWLSPQKVRMILKECRAAFVVSAT
jgi:hypothetical protein